MPDPTSEFFQKLVETQGHIIVALDDLRRAVDGLAQEVSGMKVMVRTLERSLISEHRTLSTLGERLASLEPKGAA